MQSLYQYDDLNQLTSLLVGDGTGATNFTYTYDLNSNRVTRPDGIPGGGTDLGYVYDVQNRLVEVYDLNAPTTKHLEASYDARTRRLTTTKAGATTYFRYDGGSSIQEIDTSTNQIQVEFVRGSGLGGGIGSILYSDRATVSGPVEYYCYDAVGHVTKLTDPLGAATQATRYSAFGLVEFSSGTSTNNRLANTKERDAFANTELDNHGFRYYEPAIGRYLTRDPIGYADGLNCYIYVGANPVNRIDPLGLAEGHHLIPQALWNKHLDKTHPKTLEVFKNARLTSPGYENTRLPDGTVVPPSHGGTTLNGVKAKDYNILIASHISSEFGAREAYQLNPQEAKRLVDQINEIVTVHTNSVTGWPAVCWVMACTR